MQPQTATAALKSGNPLPWVEVLHPLIYDKRLFESLLGFAQQQLVKITDIVSNF